MACSTLILTSSVPSTSHVTYLTLGTYFTFHKTQAIHGFHLYLWNCHWLLIFFFYVGDSFSFYTSHLISIKCRCYTYLAGQVFEGRLVLYMSLSVAWCDLTQVVSLKGIGIHSYACYLVDILCASAIVWFIFYLFCLL
jgi:hypothetical protein